MFRKITFLFFFLSGTIILWSITFSLFPPQSESGSIYSYTDENWAMVITNTPLPDKIRNKAKKIESYKDITDEERKLREKEKQDKMQVWKDEQARQDQNSKTRPVTGEKAKTDAELIDKVKKSEAETDKFVKSAKDAKDKAADVLDTLAPLRKFP